MSVKFTLPDVYIGDKKDWKMSFTDEANNPIDLTGRTLYFTAKIDKCDSNDKAIIKKVYENIIANSDTSNGIFNFELSSLETTKTYYINPKTNLQDDIEDGTYHCDFRLSEVMQPNVIYLTTEGVIEIEQPVTDIEND